MQDPAGIYSRSSPPSYVRETSFRFTLMTEQHIYVCEAIFSDGPTAQSPKRWTVSMMNYYEMNWPVASTAW